MFEEMFATYISTYGVELLHLMLNGVIAFVAAWVGKILKAFINDEVKRRVAKTCCKAVEQMYKDLNGEDKYNMACEFIEEMLAEKNITISALEIKMLIEEVCADFVKAVMEEYNEEDLENEAAQLTEIGFKGSDDDE